MKTQYPPPAIDLDWARLLDAEQQLEADIAAAADLARQRVAQSRAAAGATVQDAGSLAALAAADEQADVARHRSALAHLAMQAERRVRALTQLPDTLIDALAQRALDAVLQDPAGAVRR